MIEIDVTPTMDELAKDFKRREDKLANFKPPHKKVAVYLDQWVQRNIKAEGANLTGGDKWPDFQYGGRVNSEGKGQPFIVNTPFGPIDAFLDRSAKLLQLTGRLRQMMLPFAGQNAAGIGSHLNYSKIHEEGIGVPRRRILPKAAEVHDRIEEILHDHGLSALEGGGI